MWSITMRGRTPPPKRRGWGAATSAISLTVLPSLVLACAPAQPAAPSAPAPAAPAAPAAAKPAAPGAAPAASPATAPAAPAAAKPSGPATGSITVVIEAEPNTLLTKDSTTNNGQLVVDNIYDSLTRFDPQGKLVGQLAESWSRVDPTTWRFKLRQGVKFTNGEAFNA